MEGLAETAYIHIMWFFLALCSISFKIIIVWIVALSAFGQRSV